MQFSANSKMYKLKFGNTCYFTEDDDAAGADGTGTDAGTVLGLGAGAVRRTRTGTGTGLPGTPVIKTTTDTGKTRQNFDNNNSSDVTSHLLPGALSISIF